MSDLKIYSVKFFNQYSSVSLVGNLPKTNTLRFTTRAGVNFIPYSMNLFGSMTFSILA